MEETVVAFYIRLSMEDHNKKEVEKRESDSITNQRNLLFDYVNQREEFRGAKIETYVDDGYTGTNFERPAMKNLLEKVKEGGVWCILVKDFSRFGRNYIMVTDYIDQIFPFLGVRFISVNDQFDSGNLKGQTSGIDVGFKNIIMSYYSHDLSVKIKTAKRSKAKQGYYINSNAIMGYRKAKGDKYKIEIDFEAAQVVQRIFAMAMEGTRMSHIAKILNQERIPTPLYFQQKQGRMMNYATNTEDVYWKGSMVGLILRNPRYLGTYYYGNTYSTEIGTAKCKKSKEEDVIKVEQAYEPLITKEEFEKVQNILHKASFKKEPFKGVTPHLFSKKLRCGECRSLLSRVALKSGNGYQCKKREIIDRKCFRKHKNEKELSSVVLCVLKSYMQTYLEEQKVNRVPSGIADKKKQLKIYGRSVKKLEEEKVILYDKKISKEISENEYLRWKVEKDRLQEELCDKIALLEEELEELQQDNHLLDTNVLEGYLQREELTREMVECFIDCIYVYEDYIHVNWNFEVDASYTEKEIFF